MIQPARILPFRAKAKVVFEPQKRGLVPLYEVGMACPSCWNRGWIVGRQSAECSGCGTSLDLLDGRR